MSKCAVYFVQEPPQVPNATGFGSRPAYNLTPAAKRGNVRFLFDWSETESMPVEMMLELAPSRLSDFDKDDWLVLTGNPTLMTLCAMIVALRFKRLRLLVWDKTMKDYAEINHDVGMLIATVNGMGERNGD
jgi:hypothetical protein